jgi:hypothetical protein
MIAGYGKAAIGIVRRIRVPSGFRIGMLFTMADACSSGVVGGERGLHPARWNKIATGPGAIVKQRGKPSCFQNPEKLVKILFIFLLLSTSALAMDRWTALAMIESGGNDRIIGHDGEVSRYQIRRELWPGGDPLDATVALANAQRIMSPRLATFEHTYGRMPDDFEFYILWNAPAQINHPHSAVTERARRFMNLVADTDSGVHVDNH